MHLTKSFESAGNLGDLATVWLDDIQQQFRLKKITPKSKAGVADSASLISPAALLATIIQKHGLTGAKSLQILIHTDDPLVMLDRGIWLNYAANFAGVEDVHCYTTERKELESNLYESASKLGLREIAIIPEYAAAKFPKWDLVVWIHPTLEVSSITAPSIPKFIADLHATGVPIYAASYNEVDAMLQTAALGTEHEFGWVNGAIANTEFGTETINRFAFGTAELGVEGGWGAVITRLRPRSVPDTTQDWPVIHAASMLQQYESADQGRWAFGEEVAGCEYGGKPIVSLLGGLAVEPETGVVFSEAGDEGGLYVIGHCYNTIRDRYPAKDTPAYKFGLIPYAAHIKLVTLCGLTKETRKRKSTFELLATPAFSSNPVIRIALARAHEVSGTERGRQTAAIIYKHLGMSHPQSAYFLAHAGEDNHTTGTYLEIAAAAGYTPAVTDYGIWHEQNYGPGSGDKFYLLGAKYGDPQAKRFVAEGMMETGGKPEEILQLLRDGWSTGDLESAETALSLCYMLQATGSDDHDRLTAEITAIFQAKRNIEIRSQPCASAA